MIENIYKEIFLVKIPQINSNFVIMEKNELCHFKYLHRVVHGLRALCFWNFVFLSGVLNDEKKKYRNIW